MPTYKTAQMRGRGGLRKKKPTPGSPAHMKERGALFSKTQMDRINKMSPAQKRAKLKGVFSTKQLDQLFPIKKKKK